MFRKRRTELVRDPCPDGAGEARLQRIVSLQLAVARKEARLAEGAENVSRLRGSQRRAVRMSGDTAKAQKQVDAYLEEAEQLEAEITELHDEIEKRVSELAETELAYLSPRRK